MDIKIKELLHHGIAQALNYAEYGSLLNQLVLEGRTTGADQSPLYIGFTKLNHQRMRRLDKKTTLTEATAEKMKAVSEKMIWLVLTESWCGDAAQTLPIINKLAILNPNISLKLIERDQHEALMACFLTNGTRSIPKLLAIDPHTYEVKWTWGPRPSQATQLAEAYKQEHGGLTAAFKEILQGWYNKDKGQNTVEDIMGLLTLK